MRESLYKENRVGYQIDNIMEQTKLAMLQFSTFARSAAHSVGEVDDHLDVFETDVNSLKLSGSHD